MVRTWHYKQYNPFKTMKHANDLVRQIQNTSEYISDLCYICYWDEKKQELVSLHGQIPPHYDELHPTDEITIKPRKEVPLPPFPFITDELLPPSLRDEDLEMDPDGEDFDFDYDEYDDDDGEWEEVC
jgi:hypothetical protein